MIPHKNLLEELISEEETLYLASFDEQSAWEIGCLAREIAVSEELPVAIRIMRGEQILFQTSLRGSVPDNDLWLEGKTRVVYHFQRSSFYIASKLDQSSGDVQSKYHLDPALYRCKGGAIPIRVKNSGIAAVLIVSGLKDREDHKLSVRILREFMKKSSKGLP